MGNKNMMWFNRLSPWLWPKSIVKDGLNLFIRLILLLAHTWSSAEEMKFNSVKCTIRSQMSKYSHWYHSVFIFIWKAVDFYQHLKRNRKRKCLNTYSPHTHTHASTHIHSCKHRPFALHWCSHTQCFIISNSFGSARSGFYFFISAIHMREREQQCLTFPMVSMATENGLGISSTFNKSLFGISAQK